MTMPDESVPYSKTDYGRFPDGIPDKDPKRNHMFLFSCMIAISFFVGLVIGVVLEHFNMTWHPGPVALFSNALTALVVIFLMKRGGK